MNEKVSVLSGTASLGIPIAVDKKMDCINFTQKPHPFCFFENIPGDSVDNFVNINRFLSSWECIKFCNLCYKHFSSTFSK